MSMNESIPTLKYGSIADTEELDFDFDFDDLENSSDDALCDGAEEMDKPYQWSANVQFVNIDVNKMGLEPHASNNVPFGQHLEATATTKRSTSPTTTTSPPPPPSATSPSSSRKPLLRSGSDPKSRRTVSTLRPPVDIVSIEACPLKMEWSGDGQHISDSALEYIRCSVPDFSELQSSLGDLLSLSGCALRFAAYCGDTVGRLDAVAANGGCKVLHFVAMTVNPRTVDRAHPLLSTFPDTAYFAADTDYVLVQTASCDGRWLRADDLASATALSPDLNDIVIAISPPSQSRALCDVLSRRLGLRHVIGVEYDGGGGPFASSETAIFLKYFYSSILNQECVDRAFELAKTAAILQRTGSGRSVSVHSPLLSVHLHSVFFALCSALEMPTVNATICVFKHAKFTFDVEMVGCHDVNLLVVTKVF